MLPEEVAGDDPSRSELTARDLFRMESDPSEPGAWREWVDPELAQGQASSVSCFGDLLKMSDRDDAPTFSSVVVVCIDLKAANRTWTVCELGAGCSPKDDRLLTDRIVDGKDLRATGDNDRQSAEQLSAQVLPTLFFAEREHRRR